MPVRAAHSVCLEVPALAAGVAFYEDAGFHVETKGERAYVYCEGLASPSIILLGGAARKRLHHIALRAEVTDLPALEKNVAANGGSMIPMPAELAGDEAFGASGRDVWVRDPHGMVIRLVDAPEPDAAQARAPFAINATGNIVRVRQSAMLPRARTAPTKPLRLGHMLVFTPDVMMSVQFLTEALGMGLADHAQDIIAFCCARKNSDHHVVAFAKSPGIGFHHASFEVKDPDQVGRGGALLWEKSARGQWGFGRHTIGSNFFHYIQDPWGSWFEYYADMDFIDDYALWTPTNYEMEDSLANWGPPVPHDFVHNYEVAEEPFGPAA